MRYFLEFAYNGKQYYGWQRQPKDISVQQVMEERLSTMLREPVSLTGAGRTDTGVHARQMFAHFDMAKEIPGDFLHRINAFLPQDIYVYHLHKVAETAHARFDALSRTYYYFVQIHKNPFNFDSTWQVNYELDVSKMNEAAQFLLGRKDFSSFAKIHTDVKTHICDLSFAQWNRSEKGGLLQFTITADRFLRNMVRAVTGTLVDVGKGKISLEEFNFIIEKKDRSFASGSAPAQGLFLAEVKYPPSIFINE